MKDKILTISIIALLMAGGLVLISCTNPCSIEAGSCSVSVSGRGFEITSCSSSDCDVNSFMEKYKENEENGKIPKIPSCSCK
jgi:hypothetical protein